MYKRRIFFLPISALVTCLLVAFSPFQSVAADTLVALDAATTWRYNESNTDLGTAWKETNFDDSGTTWKPGAGIFATDAVTDRRTTLSRSVRTYYFRRSFDVADPNGVSLDLSFFADDGLIVYLNGTEVYRHNLPTTGVNHNTAATSNVGTASELGPFRIPSGSMQAGKNVLAVELHQNEAVVLNADATFGARLLGTFRDVVLNEIMANNVTTVENGDTFPDWIEIYNRSDKPAKLEGMKLVAIENVTTNTYTFTSTAVVPAKGYATFWCDNDLAAPGIHTTFGLKSSGAKVILQEANGLEKDLVSFGIQAPDLSIGRDPNGTGAFTLTTPTFGAVNIVKATANVTSGLLKINEWLVRPSSGDDFFELYNTSTSPVHLGGLFLTDDREQPTLSRIPDLSYITGNGFVRIIADEKYTNGADHVNFKLGNPTTTADIGIYKNASTSVDVIAYGPQTSGVSEGRLPDGASQIVKFNTAPTPGESNVQLLSNVVINEVLAHSDPPLEDAIEIMNIGSTNVAIGGWFLSDDKNEPKKYKLPAGIQLTGVGTAGSFKVFYENQFNKLNDPAVIPFSLSSANGDEVFLSTADSNGNLTGYRASVKFGASANSISFGRWVTSVGADFTPMKQRTFGEDSPTTVEQFRLGNGKANSDPLVGPIVINEIMYKSMIDTNEVPADEFVELKNTSNARVDLFDPNARTNRWQLRDAVDFVFPADISIEPLEHILIVSFDPANGTALNAFKSKFNVPSHVRVFGPFTGVLNNSEDSVELYRPDPPQGPGRPDEGFVPYIRVDRVKYGDGTGDPWPAAADGLGASLQRRLAISYGNEPTNWFGQSRTPGRENLLDADNDGMHDDWERNNGLSPTNPNDANTDLDGDGFSNVKEYKAGTNPQSNTSLLKFTLVRHSGGICFLQFQTVAGKHYQVQFRTSFTSGTWQNLPGGDVNATSSQLIEVSDGFVSQPGNHPRYYRILVE